jgi:hypothetical protein
MRQIKLFKSVETEISSLEKDVNAWVRQNRANVIRISGNIAPQTERPDGSGYKFPPSDVLVLIEYDVD